LYETEQADPQLIWLGLVGLELEGTVPLPVKSLDLLTVMGNVRMVKMAVTDLSAFMFTVQVLPDTESHPFQLV